MARDSALAPAESFSLEMNTDGVLRIKGVEDVLEFDDSKIVLLCGSFMLSLTGKALEFKTYSSNETAVGGEIQLIEFTR